MEVQKEASPMEDLNLTIVDVQDKQCWTHFEKFNLYIEIAKEYYYAEGDYNSCK